MPPARHFRADPRRIVHDTIDDETILVDLETGAYYSLKGSGPEIWGLLITGRSEMDVIGELRRRHPADSGTVADATSTLIEQLHAEGLLEELSSDSRPSPTVAGTTIADGPFESPIFERYTDMEYFLRLDPIHEVGDGGWPHPRTAEPRQPASR